MYFSIFFYCLFTILKYFLENHFLLLCTKFYCYLIATGVFIRTQLMAKLNYFTWHPPLLFLKRIFCVVVLVVFVNLNSQVIQINGESLSKKNEVSISSTSKNQLDGIYISGNAFVFDGDNIITNVKPNSFSQPKNQVKKNKKNLLCI